LRERLDLDAVEHAVDDVGIVSHQLPRDSAGRYIDDDQAAAAIGERTSEYDLSCGDQRLKMAQVRGAVLWSPILGIRCVVAYDNKERVVLPRLKSLRLLALATMAHKHEPQIPAGLDMLVARLSEVEVVLGKAVAPVLAAVRDTLIAAMAARDRGDVPAAIVHVGQAMERLAALADRLDPAEAALMRAIAGQFQTALARGDEAHAKRSAAVMFERSGAVERKPR